MFPILVDVFAELQVVNSWGYWRLPPPFEADVRFCECVWCVNARPGIDESSNCPADVFRCITPIWLLHSLFGDDSWSELSGILVSDYFFQLLSRGSREAHFFSLPLRRLRRALLGRDRDRRLALSIGGIKRDSNESYDAYLRFDVTRRKNKHPLLERSTLRFDRPCFIHVPAIRYSSFINPTHINLPAEAT